MRNVLALVLTVGAASPAFAASGPFLSLSNTNFVVLLAFLLFIGILLWLGNRSSLQFGILALFPVVIISFLAERIHNMVDESDWRGMMITGAGTWSPLFPVTTCFPLSCYRACSR